jgi:hypothetical protein
MTKNAGNIAAVIERMERRERIDIAERQSRKQIKEYIASEERENGVGEEVGGTGLTILKFRKGSPLARLADRGSIGKQELDAAEDIYHAFMALAGNLMIKPQSLERTDKTNGLYEPTRQIDSVARYRAWANHWSARKRLGDRTLEIVIAVVIDEQPLRQIEEYQGLKHGRAGIIVSSGLRDYVARAGWAPKDMAGKWIVAAESNFVLRRAKA